MVDRTVLSPELRAAAVTETRKVVNSDGKAVAVEQTRRKRIIDI
jgi:hypothetical protein